MHTDYETYRHTTGRHAYDVTVYEDKQCRTTKNFKQKTFQVSAANRDHAARIVARDGYEVGSVNMVG